MPQTKYFVKGKTEGGKTVYWKEWLFVHQFTMNRAEAARLLPMQSIRCLQDLRAAVPEVKWYRAIAGD